MLDAGTIGKTIRSLREQRGMSQEVLSGLAGMYKSHLGRIERGEKKPNLDSLCRIASALGMQPHELLKRIEEQAQTP
jgi:transcriptional regulator with XRE-family HTH domain